MAELEHEIIESILPANEVSILAGASGAGKTTLIMQILKEILSGGTVFNHAVRSPLKIGYIAADRTWRSYERTAKGVGLVLDKLQLRALVDDPGVDLVRFEKSPIEELERLIASMLPVDLVVVDPLVVFLGVDTNKYHLNAARLIRLNKLCMANGVTILGTHHATKARSDYSFKRAQDRISGTSALLGFTSTQLFLAAPEETGREDGLYEWHVISHHAAPRIILMDRKDGRFSLVAEESLRQDPIDLKLLAFIASRPSTTRQEIVSHLADRASPSTIDRILKQSLDAGLIQKAGSGLYVAGTGSAS